MISNPNNLKCPSCDGEPCAHYHGETLKRTALSSVFLWSFLGAVHILELERLGELPSGSIFNDLEQGATK